jgi:hypothetical protein
MLRVYAITDRAPLRLGRGAEKERLRAVAASGLVLVVGEVGAPPLTPEALTAHDAVVRRLAGRCPALLPARFSWTAASDAELAGAIAPHREDVLTALRLVTGCVQMNVRVLGKRPAVAASTRATENAAAAGEGEGTRYLKRRAHVLREAESLPELAPLNARLEGLLRARREERQAAGDLLGTAYHLVGRGRLRTYRARVARAAATLRPLRLRVSGPWAAYAFGPETLR